MWGHLADTAREARRPQKGDNSEQSRHLGPGAVRTVEIKDPVPQSSSWFFLGGGCRVGGQWSKPKVSTRHQKNRFAV